MLLAKDGLPSGGSIGYEIFDRSDSLTASTFQQGISQTRAMEGELARTIRTLQGVRAARVHLVLPRREPFARDRLDAQASVVITMAGAARLDREGVQAVLNLIAAAVPGLKPQNIAIIDTRGNLLARAGQPTAGIAAAQTGEELKRAYEARIARAVEEMLERTVGPGRVRAEASVDLDFEQVHETQEKYDPDGQVVRSQQNSTGNTRTTEQAQSVSVQNNLPNADPAANANGTTDQKSEETTNYEISKTIRTMVRDQPQLKRLSLAVMVDGVVTPGADGKPAWAPRPEDELARIANLVRSAVGFDEKRGDRVEVVSMRFTVPEDGPEAAALPIWAQFDKADLVRLIEGVLLTLAVVLCLTKVLRPMVLRIAVAQPGMLAAAIAGAPGAAALNAGTEDGAALQGPGVPGKAAPGMGATASGAASSAAEEVMRLANVEGELRVASLRRVSELVSTHPDETLAMVRSWIAPDDSR
jgi:flagellar M-ring protein FliF